MNGCKHAPKAHNNTNYCPDCIEQAPTIERMHKWLKAPRGDEFYCLGCLRMTDKPEPGECGRRS